MLLVLVSEETSNPDCHLFRLATPTAGLAFCQFVPPSVWQNLKNYINGLIKKMQEQVEIRQSSVWVSTKRPAS